MRLPRVRFTVRRIMLAVAMTAIAMGGLAYGMRLLRLQSTYRSQAAEMWTSAARFRTPTYRTDVVDLEAADRFDRWAEQYEWAARHPWVPLKLDPPMPK